MPHRENESLQGMPLEELLERVNAGRQREKGIIERALRANPRDLPDDTLYPDSPPLSGYGAEADSIFARRSIRSGTDLGHFLSNIDLAAPTKEADEKTPTAPITGISAWDRVPVEEEEQKLGFDPEAAPYQRQEGQSWGQAFGVGAGNIPHSVGERFDELGAVLEDPMGAAEGIYSLAKGIGKSLYQDRATRREDPDVELARGAVREFKASFTPEQLQEDPTAAIANVASVLFPGIKGLQLVARGAGATRAVTALGRAATAADIAADPAISIIRGTGKVAKAGGKQVGGVAAKIGTELLGVTTGRQGGPIREAFRAGLEGVEQREAFLKAVADKTVSEDTVVQISNLLRAERTRLGEAVTAFRHHMQDNPQLLDIRDVKQAVFDDANSLLKEFGGEITEFPSRTEQVLGMDPGSQWQPAPGAGTSPFYQRTVDVPDKISLEDSFIYGENADTVRAAAKKGLNKLFESPDKISALQLDRIKKGMQDFTSSSASAEALIHKVSSALRKKLYDDVDGYAKAFSESDELYTFLDNMKRRTSLNVDEPFTQEANQAFRSALNEDKDTAMRAVRALEAKFGTKALPIRAEIAGQALSRDVPSGLMGRSALLGIVGGGTAVMGAFVNPAIFLGLMGLPAFFPAYVGKWMARAGAGTRVVKETVDSLQGLLEYAKINKIPVSKSLTIAQLVERITNDPSSPSEAPGVFDEEEPQRQSLMSRLGAAEGAARDSAPSVSHLTPLESGPMRPLFEPTMDPAVEDDPFATGMRMRIRRARDPQRSAPSLSVRR